MTHMMKKTLALVMLVTLLLSSLSAAFAANVCPTIAGDSSRKFGFTVTTKVNLGDCKITIKPSKGTALFRSKSGKELTADTYCPFKITASKFGKETNYSMCTTATTIKMNWLSTYYIKVIPQKPSPFKSTKETFEFVKWVKPAKWSIGSTKGVFFCND